MIPILGNRLIGLIKTLEAGLENLHVILCFKRTIKRRAITRYGKRRTPKLSVFIQPCTYY